MAITIKEISKKLNISQATVSLALNNKPGVGEKTKQMVWEVAEAYGYKKINNVKRNILFVKYVDNGEAIEHNGDFVARIIDAIESTASELSYNLVFKNIQSQNYEKEIKSINYEEFAGILFLATELENEKAKYLEEMPIPVVAVDNMLEDYEVDAIVMDNYGGISSAVNYLYQQGHRRIGYLDSKIRFCNFDQRTFGYYRALEKVGLVKDKSIIKKVYPGSEGAYKDMLKILADKEELPTAFVAGNDSIAIGAIKAFKEFNMDIPNQMSIIGFDDIPFCSMLDKGLSTVQVDKTKIGMLAVKLLDSKIMNAKKIGVKIAVRNKLIIRESVVEYND